VAIARAADCQIERRHSALGRVGPPDSSPTSILSKLPWPKIRTSSREKSTELGRFRALGWPMPARILDLYAEFRNRVNGIIGDRGLIDARCYFGLDARLNFSAILPVTSCKGLIHHRDATRYEHASSLPLRDV